MTEVFGMAYRVRLASPMAASTRVMHCSGGDASYPVTDSRHRSLHHSVRPTPSALFE